MGGSRPRALRLALGGGLSAFSWALAASAQLPVPGPAESPPASEGSASPALPPSPPPPPPQPQPAAAAPAPTPPPKPAAASAPPLDPPPPSRPSNGPSFLRPPADTSEPVAAPPRRRSRVELPRDFALKQSPWVDFSLTNFWLDERTSNFLNVGVQVGGYFVDRLRVTVRLVAPIEEAEDDHRDYGSFDSGFFGYERRSWPSVSVLYGGSLGLILSSSRSFLFAPSILVMRTNVNAYGTAAALALPFDWTTSRHLRVGFELAIGHAFGGTAYDGNGEEVDRPGGTALFLQFHMGWSMGHL